MKRFLFYAAALIAVVACSREPVIPEEPEKPGVEQSGPINVTLVADSPSTRTELGYDNGALKPYWSVGDNISVIRVPNFQQEENFEVDEYGNYVYHPFSGNVENTPSLSAQFTGSVSLAGQYRAIYPDREIGAGGWSIDWTWKNDVRVPYFSFTIPSIQEPTPTSFDKRADLLVSAPFDIESGDEYTLGGETDEIPIRFTRANAIVKIKLNPASGLQNKLRGQKVRRVVLGEYSESSGSGEVQLQAPRPQTRANYTDGKNNFYGLTGRISYFFPYFEGDLDNYDVTEADSYEPAEWGVYYAVAEYTDDTAYDILTDNEEIATYLIVAPSILVNTELGHWEYVGDEEVWQTTGMDGLHLQIETDHYIIERNIILPSTGIALQPSVVTTLNITIDENNSDTIVREKEISFEESEQTFFPYNLSSKFGYAELVLSSSDMAFDIDVLDPSNWSFSVNDIVSLDLSDAYPVQKWDENKQKNVNGVAGIYVVGQTVGETTLTVNYKGSETSCNIHVIGLDDPLAQPIEFDDWDVWYICVEQWGNNIVEDELTYYEASKVKWLTRNDQEYGVSVFRYHDYHNYINTFDELKYFTGLRQIGEYDFLGCQYLYSITLPDSVTGIASEAFSGCSNLESIHLSKNLTWIGYRAFYSCSQLHQIVFPASLNSVGVRAFEDVTFYSGMNNGVNYNGVKFLGNTPPHMEGDIRGVTWVDGYGNWGFDIYVPQGAKAAYEAESYILNSYYGPNRIHEFYFEDDYGPDNAAGNPFVYVDGGSF